MPSLSKLLSRSGESKEKSALQKPRASVSVEEAPPPPYTQEPVDEEDIIHPADLTAGFANLNLDSTQSFSIPQPQECVAHLKLLESFSRLRQKIGSTEGLFGISDSVIEASTKAQDTEETNRCRAVISEKRWQVYVSRAVLRFERWRNAIEPQYDYLHFSDVLSDKISDTVKPQRDVKAPLVRAENLPPIDVLMIWHSYMLNPRAYLEDCVRTGRMSLWHCPMPWQLIADSIENETFAFQPEPEVRESFEDKVGIAWYNLDDSSNVSIACARCFTPNLVPWTETGDLESIGESHSPDAISEHFSHGTGYADKDFAMTCEVCGQFTDHDGLCVGKFLKDISLLLDQDVMVRGTFFDRDGLPHKSLHKGSLSWLPTFPSRLLKAGLGKAIIDYCKGSDSLQMVKIREYIEEGLKDTDLVRLARDSASSRLLTDERIAVRRMMSRYWDNSSSFCLDLVGAVSRQGSFVEKMHDIDWLHSPALPATMSRLILKYTRFVNIMKDRKHMAVPTLDVDLAWHTHQLNPFSYFHFTVKETGQFIDHDDKVAETKLNDAFAWTSKTYQKLYNEPYSECTCWYCEAIRESHTSTASRMFRSSTASAADSLHQVAKNPRKSVHISAHNAVNPTDNKGIHQSVAKAKAAELEKHYQKACARAEKKGRPKPRRDEYYYSEAYGYPVYLTAYMPFYAMPMYPMMYPVNPGCMAISSGAVGNCCSGTCGGAIAAGGSCGGGVSAACGGAGVAGACAGSVGGFAGNATGFVGCGGGGACGGGGGGGCGGGGC